MVKNDMHERFSQVKIRLKMAIGDNDFMKVGLNLKMSM